MVKRNCNSTPALMTYVVEKRLFSYCRSNPANKYVLTLAHSIVEKHDRVDPRTVWWLKFCLWTYVRPIMLGRGVPQRDKPFVLWRPTPPNLWALLAQPCSRVTAVSDVEIAYVFFRLWSNKYPMRLFNGYCRHGNQVNNNHMLQVRSTCCTR